MDKPKYIISFLSFAGNDEQKILYFSDENNAKAVFASLRGNDALLDCHLSKIIDEEAD